MRTLTVMFFAFIVFTAVAGIAMHQAEAGPAAKAAATPSANAVGAKASHSDPRAPTAAKGEALALFAGGCFWCMEKPFDKLEGVLATTSGYSGGQTQHPSYQQVSAGGTGHAESLLVRYDPSKISYAKLLATYWHNVDPLTKDAQFCDHGSQYRTAIFALNASQLKQATASKAALQASGSLKGQIVTQVVAAGPFWPAEEYHQDYYRKNPIRYHYYRSRCGRDDRLEALWGDEAGH